MPCRIYSHQLVSSRGSFASSRRQSGQTEYPESWQIVTHRWRSQQIALFVSTPITTIWKHDEIRSVVICCNDLRSDTMVTIDPAIVLIVENFLTAKNVSTINPIAAINIKMRNDLIRSDAMIPDTSTIKPTISIVVESW